MIKIKNNVSLAPLTTLSLGGRAKYFCVVSSQEDLQSAWSWAQKENCPIFVLGGGSNTFFPDHGFSGLVIKNEIKGIKKNGQNSVQSASGELWPLLVSFCLKNNLYGLENLIYIPGTVGGAVVQNIGAYGVEQAEFFESLELFDLKTGKFKNLKKKDLAFAYRSSFLKDKKNIGRYFVLSVTYRLKNKFQACLKYPPLKNRFSKEGDIKELLKEINYLRTASLPSLKDFYSAGSFFKNPELSQKKLNLFSKKNPQVKFFGRKVSAAWLIENAGLKGFSLGKAMVSEKHALILGHRGGAKSRDLHKLKELVKRKVYQKFEIKLEEEVFIVD